MRGRWHQVEMKCDPSVYLSREAALMLCKVALKNDVQVFDGMIGG